MPVASIDGSAVTDVSILRSIAVTDVHEVRLVHGTWGAGRLAVLSNGVGERQVQRGALVFERIDPVGKSGQLVVSSNVRRRGFVVGADGGSACRLGALLGAATTAGGVRWRTQSLEPPTDSPTERSPAQPAAGQSGGRVEPLLYHATLRQS